MSHLLRNGIIAAALLACSFAVPAAAQSTRDGDLNEPAVTNSDGRRDRNRNRRAEPEMSAEEARAQAQTLATTAGLTCQVSEAKLLGRDAERQSLFEAACSDGPGYLILASTPPVAQDCLELTAAAEAMRRANPEAPAGQQCALPANLDVVRAVTALAQQAQLTCQVDAGRAVGKSSENFVVYEVGCADADGYQIEKKASGWAAVACIRIAREGACQFTTAEEQARAFTPKLADTAASACDVQQLRFMGENPNGSFFEAKCAAPGEGYIARLNAEGVAEQIYPCATAQRIGGGCTLTPAPAAAPATPPAAE